MDEIKNQIQNSSKYDKNYFFIIAFSAYILTSLFLYHLYSSNLQSKIQYLLKENYEIVLNNSVVKLDYLTQQFSLDEREKAQISIDKTNIKNCISEKCLNINLLEFVSELNKYVPAFVNYKIEVNRQHLSSNNKLEKYQIEKMHQISPHNLISIGISLDDAYISSISWNLIVQYLSLSSANTFLFMLFILFAVRIEKSFRNFYKSKFELEYSKFAEALQKDFEGQLKEKENHLQKKIWDLEYNNEKDLEIHRILSEEAHKLTLMANKQEDSNEMRNIRQGLCTLSLYVQREGYEKIKVSKLTEIFLDRYDRASKELDFGIKSDFQDIKFTSKAVLYQIIYSILTYLYFILNRQSDNSACNLRLEIGEKYDRASLKFKFNGRPIRDLKELSKYYMQFFQKNVDPFILSLDQIHEILKAEKYSFNIGFKGSNYISIEKLKEEKSKNIDNVIRLRPLNN